MLHALVLLSSLALAVRVPSTTRCAPPCMLVPASEPPQQLNDEETRDDAISAAHPTARPAVKKGMSFGDYLKGGAVSTNAQPQASQPVTAAAPTRDLAPRAAPVATPTILVQGGSLKTWTYRNPGLDRVQFVLSSEGRPIDAEVELWAGPGNVPSKMKVYVEDGELLPFTAVFETPTTFPGNIKPQLGEEGVVAKPRAVPSTVAIRNTGQLEFPFAANVFTDDVDGPSAECAEAPAMKVQGGALRTYPFDPSVGSVQVFLTTDGRPLEARIEILQGPNNNKQVVELYSEDGLNRPFFAIFGTPGGYGSVVRVLNTASMEYPLSATVAPDSIGDFGDGLDAMDDGLNAVGDPPRMGRYDTVY